ncbi:lysophospholipase [Pseudomonas sp. 5P_3.1_Bac2]|uniref:lysophospholipase n=1 Tax=Pseudomonas sp. 5P_3.1_Bac2 TaxID=2971617 RepID=UPI0021C7FD33|nr:lysophospholipase [Pseudomonas sp. 5P_3.1_Bac2]MCU1717261.1 lysophospholipase [Pseudomonas sp. 5P_3.1_Bac2]
MRTVNAKEVERCIEYLPMGDCNLALHSWTPEAPKAAVFYFHGLQSHAGWLWEAGCQFAENDVAFYALDRRGCGISDGPRGELAPVEQMLADYRSAIRSVREKVGDNIPLGLFGHCLGGSFLAALLADPAFETEFESLVFCSAWLGKIHHTLPPHKIQALLRDQSDELWDAGLKAEDFSDQSRYVDFISTDVLATRQLKASSRARLVEMEMMYLYQKELSRNTPSIYISGYKDPVINLDSAKKQYLALFGNQGETLELAANKHYLLYTNVRQRLINQVSAYVSSHGHSNHV